jgi:serine/threonine-protein kinase RsbT
VFRGEVPLNGGGEVFLYYVILNSGNLDNVGITSTEIKRRLQEMGVEDEVVKRVSIICFEAEMNLASYADRGGHLKVEVKPERVEVVVEDDGPGIEDLEQAMTPGYSTAPLWIRELGFGAGLGLPNIKDKSDVFHIESEVGKGTKINAVVFRRKDAA